MKIATHAVLVTLAAAALALASCRPSPQSGIGLSLPEGDIDRGKAAFINLKCTECHTVRDLPLPTPERIYEPRVELGGIVFSVKTYGELVTSIINPDHRLASKYARSIEGQADGEQVSPMPDLTRTMTVAQMIDLVAFLHSRYILRPTVDYSPYPLYP